MDYDVIVIGGGPAGMTAGLYAARAGLSVLLLEKAFPGGQAARTDKIMNYPGFPDGIGGPELSGEMLRQAENAGVQVEYAGCDGVDALGAEKTVRVGAKSYTALSIVFAMGAQPALLGIPGEAELTGRGVSYCATCDGALYRGRNVAVVGGGNTAVEDVTYLSGLCRQVFWFHRRDSLRASGAAAEKAKALPNVTTRFGTQILSIARGDGGLTLLLSDGETAAVDAVFVAVGTKPETELLKGSIPLDDAGAIPAGEDCETGVPGLFCAGDCRKKPLRQVVTAAADGAVAGAAAANYVFSVKEG